MVFNRQKKIALDEGALAAFLARILKEMKLEGIEVSVALVTDAVIAKWNKNYRQKIGPTDVLSFPAMDRRRLAHFKRKAAHAAGKENTRRVRGNVGQSLRDKPGQKFAEDAGYLGDIAIAPETAQRYAAKNGRDLVQELRVLMLHGVLHLLDFDHETDHGQMNRVEQKLRRRLGIA